MREEREFVLAVRNFVRMTPAGNEGALRIESPEQAFAALTAMLAHQKANIEIVYVPSGLRVEMIDYLHRDDPNALWETFRSDTVIRRNATAYRFKYRLPGAAQATVVDVPCANGCRVP